MMSYLKEFLTQIENRDFSKFLVLWEEYCTSDTVDAEEFTQLLKAIKSSDMAKRFGQMVETALPLWQTITDEKESYEVLRLLIDLETTNSPILAEITLETLKKAHSQDPKFNDRLRLIGLRNKENFQGAISKYDLLAHMAKGNVVFHTGGWGTGEIVDVSFVREHLVIEFENVSGRKDLSFANAFKTLIPLPPNHFLARRFSNPDLLEKEGRENPVALIKLFLRDMGPKAAGEIKDELCELVIPEKDWTKWWQGARAKLKKDPMIETPESLKASFYLRKAELLPEERLQTLIKNKTDPNEIIQTTYNFVRDTPSIIKNPSVKQHLQDKLIDLLKSSSITEDQSLQIYLLLEQFFGYQAKEGLAKRVQENKHLEEIIQQIDIIAFKKRLLVAIKEYRKDWDHLFLSLLFIVVQAQLRDYIFKELNQGETKKLLENKLKELLDKPYHHPEMFVWYFQKLINADEDELIPYQNKEGQGLFFESFFVLFHYLENQPEYRELLKKMYGLLSGKRYALVRQLLQGTSLEFTKEFLLLASKCQSLTNHDMKILRSLAEVVHPSLVPPKQRKGSSHSEDEPEILWTTENGYLKTQDRIRQIGTVEIIENAREIEAARALGDLRENSEFKFAQERRARLQSELKTLSEQLNRARIITTEDVHFEEVGVGSVIEVIDAKGQKTRYMILGPWDANPDENILSFNSKLAQAMIGKKKGENFHFKDEKFQIASLSSYFEQ
jgi:transcription elongation factor GreA-like protein/transcription elongation GreA/GreB family factor